MERGEWDSDAEYPRAPLPAHERTWRHPSEFGAAHWVQSEPPLVVGRGLFVATGTVGAVLALGLLWLLVPHPGSVAEVAVEASTTTVLRASLTAAETTPTRVAVGSGDAAAGSLSATRSDNVAAVSSVAQTAAPSSAVLSLSAPAPTMLLGRGDLSASTPLPVAVALMPGRYIVTTAAAVQGRERFTVQLPTGEAVIGTVVAVDTSNGTAVLSVGTDVAASLIEVSRAEIAGSGFTVMTPRPSPVRLWSEGAVTLVGYQDETNGNEVTGEGSLVLDGDGRLVGICTKSAARVQLVAVDLLLAALAALHANGESVSLGITTGLDADGLVTVVDVFGGGPASAAGLLVGDVILGIDSVPVTGPEGLRAVVGGRQRGESVALTVERTPLAPPGATDAGSPSTIEIVVTLA